MVNPELRKAFTATDGALPDINFDFQGERVVADAYALVQSFSTTLASKGPTYWSRTQRQDREIHFGENPAQAMLSGEAEPFHVVFGGLRSRRGHGIPDLGVFVLGPDCLTLDYRLGAQWSDVAIDGLLDLMHSIARLASGTVITHEGNPLDASGALLIGALREQIPR